MILRLIPCAALLACQAAFAQQIASSRQPAQLDIRAAGDGAIRITLQPINVHEALPFSPALAERMYVAPVLSVRALAGPMKRRVGALNVDVRPDPLTIVVTNAAGVRVQRLVFERDGTLLFTLDDAPVLGMGEGGPRPGRSPP